MKSGIILAIAAVSVVAIVASKKSSSKLISLSPPKPLQKKFPGYEIKDQHLYIIDANKAKKHVFNIGKTKPEGALFKEAFGADYITYTDVKKDYVSSDTVNFVVKDENQQKVIYFLLTYLFAGAYEQNPHRVGRYADILNDYTVFLKNMFNTDFPVIKSIDEAKEFFTTMAGKV